ncbi:hypothetical protein HRG_014830 [Hirsutella rhossiliensis]
MGQLLQGIAFLEDNGFRLTRFNETQVLADLAGNVKISGQEWCDVGAIYTVLNGLMSFTHHIMFPWRFNDEVARLEIWPERSKAMDFWCELTIGVSTKSLAKVLHRSTPKHGY